MLAGIALVLATSVVPRYAAVVDARFAGADSTVVDGAPVFHTLAAAISSLPVNGAERAVIFIRNGRYHEKLTIDRPRLTLVGESRDSAVLTYDAIADTPAPGGGTYGTRGSFTLRIAAPDFRAEHLTIENSFDYLTNAKKAADDSSKRRNAQGVALAIDNGSDRASFEDVRIAGHQDTLFPNVGRSYFHHSIIAGSVDFIFGAGRAVFEDCDIVSRDRGSATNNGYVTAPSTPASQAAGFVFLHSRLQKENAAMAPSSVVLGRPWHPFADAELVPSAVYIECWMDDHISDKGWDRMSMTDSTGTRVWWEPTTARFFEYRTSGPGARSTPQHRQLTESAAQGYSRDRVLDGWTPPGAPTPHQ
jgi:pectinesterase